MPLGLARGVDLPGATPGTPQGQHRTCRSRRIENDVASISFYIAEATLTQVANFGLLLQAIRRKEAEVKRRLAAERETVESRVASAERQARELLTAAEIEGQRVGEAQRQATLAEAEREAATVLTRARAEAELLQRVGEQRMPAAVARAVEIVLGGLREA